MGVEFSFFIFFLLGTIIGIAGSYIFFKTSGYLKWPAKDQQEEPTDHEAKLPEREILELIQTKNALLSDLANKAEIIAQLESKLNKASREISELTTRFSESQATLRERTAAFEREREFNKKHEVTAQIIPFKNEEGDDGIFFDERKVEIGYTMQLLIGGIPVGSPTRVIQETLHQKSANKENVEKCVQASMMLLTQMSNGSQAIKLLKNS